MRTRSRSRSRNNSPQREASPAIVEPLRIELPFLEDQFQENTAPESPMADNRTMTELLQAPTEGYEDAIVILEITANNFELKHAILMCVVPVSQGNRDSQVPRESTFTLEHVIRRVSIVAEMVTPTGTNGVAKTNIRDKIPVVAQPLAEGHIFRLSSLRLSKRSLQQQRMFVHGKCCVPFVFTKTVMVLSAI
nr:reverse transcriptase domain-containing protein [Tanacetum cinerariifolium]